MQSPPRCEWRFGGGPERASGGSLTARAFFRKPPESERRHAGLVAVTCAHQIALPRAVSERVRNEPRCIICAVTCAHPMTLNEVIACRRSRRDLCE